MYECPNCAANLKFHVGKQMLFCEACETTMTPHAFHKMSDAEENLMRLLYLFVRSVVVS